MTRRTASEKQAIVDAVHRLGQGELVARHVDAVARSHGVSRRTIYRWISDSRQADSGTTTRANRATVVDTPMLTVIADAQSLLAAHEQLTDAGVVDYAYSTFCRAVKRVDPAILQGALSGRAAMVDKRLYLSNPAPHRCYAYHLDHTPLDLFVLPSHRHSTPVRPFVTVVVDAYSGYIWAFPWYARPRGQDVAAALAAACVETVIEGTSVGGVPQMVVMDNAGEHFTEAVRNACGAMGIVIAPTSARSSWQNGIAERAIGLVNHRLTASAPGATRVGRDRSSTRFLASERAKTPTENLWTAASMELALAQVVREINTGIRREDRGHRTRLELFSEDPTDRAFLSETAARLVALAGDKALHTASKSGIRFRNRHYAVADIHPGRQYQVRYLPGIVDFIEVLNPDGTHVGRAFNQETLGKSERNRILEHRKAQEREVSAIEEGVRQHRVHIAALGNAHAAALHDMDSDLGETLTATAPSPAGPAGTPRRPKLMPVVVQQSQPRALPEVDPEGPRAKALMDLIARVNTESAADDAAEGGHTDE